MKEQNTWIPVAVVVIVAIVAGYVGFMVAGNVSCSPSDMDVEDCELITVHSIETDDFGGRFGVGFFSNGQELVFEFSPKDEPIAGSKVMVCVRNSEWWVTS